MRTSRQLRLRGALFLALYLLNDFSDYGSFGSAGLPVWDPEEHEWLLLAAAHTVGALARAWQAQVSVYSTPNRPVSPLQQFLVGRTIRSAPPDLAERCSVDAALIKLYGSVTASLHVPRGALHRE